MGIMNDAVNDGNEVARASGDKSPVRQFIATQVNAATRAD
jgi:hypothetical protein